METIVKKFGNSLGVLLPASLRKDRNIKSGTRVDIIEGDSNLIITLRGSRKKIPSLKDMLEQCELDSETHPDLVAFESSPPVGQEII